MKNVSLILIAMVLAPAAVQGQGLPDDPAPAPQQYPSNPQPAQPSPPTRNAFWQRVQQIANGEEVLVTSTYGPPSQCRFAGATDDYLFCDPPGSPAGTGYRFERATVLEVKVVRSPRDWHPGILSAMIAGGILTGFAATYSTDAGNAAKYGAIGAVATGIVASPFLLSSPYVTGAGVVIRPDGLPNRRFRIFRFIHH